MAGGAGRQRAGNDQGSQQGNGIGNGSSHGGYGNNGRAYQGAPPMQYIQYHQQHQEAQQSLKGQVLSPKTRSGGFDGPGEHSRNPPSMFQQQALPATPTQGNFTPGGSQSGSNQSAFPGMSANPGSGNPGSQRGPAPTYQIVSQEAPQGGPRGPGSQAQQNPFAGTNLGYDPAKTKFKERMITNSRMELPAEAYNLENTSYDWMAKYPQRKGNYNNSGKTINIRVNQFKVTKWPQGTVHQYDIKIGDGAEKRGKVFAAWNSRAVQDRLRSVIGPNAHWLWDGNKIAWCIPSIPEQRITVNFDEERGRGPRRDGKLADTCYVIIKQTTSINMNAINAYLDGTLMDFDNEVLAAINFLDHAMRQGPSEIYTMIKRSFFSRGNVSHHLQPKSSIGAPSTGLALNVDVANGTFWAAQDIHQAARNYTSVPRNKSLSYTTFRDNLLPVRDVKHGGWTMSEDFKTLRKLVKLKFIVKHRGKGDDKKIYTIKKFSFEKADSYSKTGANAKTTSFKYKDPKNNFKEVDLTVYDFFKKVYNIDLQYWYLPLVVTEKAGMFPMELCTLVPNQRYNYKLSPEQTASMIKFAVTRPKDRILSIQHGVQMLKWNEDKYLRHFGVQVEPAMTVTQARLLPNPEIQFTGSKTNPGTAGRWDLRGKKFWLANPEPLRSWGFVIVGGACSEAVVRNFANVFIQTYTGHGGKILNKNPVIYAQERQQDLAVTVVNARIAAGNQANALPQILFYVLPGRDSYQYERLKKNSECRFALVSQCVNVAHVIKAQPQYCSNVAMKVNAKLGGTTSKIVTPKGMFSVPTMIIGADVSHASPGSPQASMAAITMSMDKECCRYAAAVQTNGYRVEMITRNNIEQTFRPLFKHWVGSVGGGNAPKHIYYFRDGVSEGQYAHVLKHELNDMKGSLIDIYGEDYVKQIKWTVVVCTKRHHIRFFPKEGDNAAGDRNNNPLPGTLVEKDITHPREYDFYLCSHTAIQGTARPVHYHVILDDIKPSVNDFQKMIYQSSYQYMRSTTPVSLFPAVYYAHLASNRARAHAPHPHSDGPTGGQKFEEAQQDAVAFRIGDRNTNNGSSQTGTSMPTEAAPLFPLGNMENREAMIKIRTSMWYI
ncbi:eukaryotic translation initiation factor-like protein 2C 2 [Diplocarpon rosae]|nr:eukaryotic translation initiation factor-like protein 2C 2 [Diplocarpon rosae]